ncbi:hypothetical protein ACFFIR_12630, partial [Microbacterium arthrosphaerae]
SEDAAAAALRDLVGAGLDVVEFAAAQGALERTFLDLGDGRPPQAPSAPGPVAPSAVPAAPAAPGSPAPPPTDSGHSARPGDAASGTTAGATDEGEAIS